MNGFQAKLYALFIRDKEKREFIEKLVTNKDFYKDVIRRVPLFSVILPTYNRSFCITKAINSLLCQTYQNFELIIVDDGSSDDTENLIKSSYAKEISNKKIVYKKLPYNQGVCRARNEGQKLAKGKWIAYLDSDNEMCYDFLDTFMNAIIVNNNSKVFYAQIRRQSDGGIIGREFDFDELCRENYIDMGVFVHHRSIIDRCGNFDENLRRYEDWELIIRYTRVEKPIYLARSLLLYNDSNMHKRISNQESKDEAEKYIFDKLKKYNGLD